VTTVRRRALTCRLTLTVMMTMGTTGFAEPNRRGGIRESGGAHCHHHG
jgi:hypothetical protein